MNTQAQADERQALNANDVHVLTGQLNEAIKRAAEQGLRVEVSCGSIMDVKGAASCYPVVSVRLLSELR
jgi:hypothetical protein